MPTPRTCLLSLLILAVLGGPALAEPGTEADPVVSSNHPRVGSIAPAFALYPLDGSKGLRGTSSDYRQPTQLDDICGLRPGNTKAVVLLFVDAQLLENLLTADRWWKAHHRDGLQILAISLESSPDSFSAEVKKADLGFPVLNGRHGVVASRYGLSGAPFSMLLNEECRVIGYSNRALSVDSEALEDAMKAQLNGQLGTAAGSMR